MLPAGANGDLQVVGSRATEDEWLIYYDRADAQRAAVGDPFRRHIARAALRGRILFLGSSFLVLGLVTSAFYLLTR
jgi:hypothetical protein